MEAYRQCLITLGKHAIYIEFELSPARLKRYPRYSTIACNRLATLSIWIARKTGGVREATERAGDNSLSCCPLQARLQFIENAFWKLKAMSRSRAERMVDVLGDAVGAIPIPVCRLHKLLQSCGIDPDERIFVTRAVRALC